VIHHLGRRYDIAQLLPHGASMRLLDALVEYGHEHIVCAVDVSEASAFFEPGHGVPWWVGVEYMAQTMGAYAGIMRLEAGRPIDLALLLGTRAFTCARPAFAAGTHLQVRATLLLEETGVFICRCELHDGDELLSRAEVKGFQPHDIQPYLESLKTGAGA
jgi:predicted hotdog family 3-hydroxylacyl-ACP dehydratase